MREFPQWVTVERVTPDGVEKAEYLFSIASGWGGMNLRTEQLNYERRSRRCKWVHKPSCIGHPIPDDVRAEARERFHKMIDEMLEEA